jgi:hypothetical protein
MVHVCVPSYKANQGVGCPRQIHNTLSKNQPSSGRGAEERAGGWEVPAPDAEERSYD